MFRKAFAIASLVFACSAMIAAEPIEEADRAYADGELARALELYERALENDPDNGRALVRSAQLRSWEGDYDVAIARYDRVLSLDPDNDFAFRERAKVLSWSGRYDRAAAAFSTLIERDPTDVDARLGRARSLSWSGRQHLARPEYRAVLDLEPDSADAWVGIGQTYAWSGEPGLARPAYERALEIDPDHRGARLALAYLDIGERETVSAGRRVAALREAYPDDREVAELAANRARWLGPYVSFGLDWLDDSDDNDLRIARAEVGSGFGPRLDARVGYARYDMRSAVDDGSIDSLYGRVDVQPAERHRLRFGVGVDRSTFTDGSDGTTATGLVGWTWRFSPAWRVDVDATRETFRYSTAILDADVAIDRFGVVFQGTPVSRVRLVAGADAWDLSDGNARAGARVEGWYRFILQPVRIDAGYLFEFFDFDRDLNNGYFDPDGFTAHLAALRVSDRFGARDNTWRVDVRTGLQSFELNGIDSGTDTVFAVDASVLVPFRDPWTFYAYAGYSDYAAQSAGGFESRRAGFRFTYRWGRAR